MSEPSKINQRLKEVMKEHDLSRSVAAGLAMVSDSALDRYLAPTERLDAFGNMHDNPQYRSMPLFRLNLIEMHIKHPVIRSDAETAELLANTK